MNSYIHKLKAVINPHLPINGQTIVPGFHHQFLLAEESILPQWSKVLKQDGVIKAVAEFNWLTDAKADVDTLHSMGCHHRDEFIETENVVVKQTLDTDGKLNVAAERFREAGLEIESIEDLQQAFINNGMMTKHLTMEACIEEMGIEDEVEHVLIAKGETGPNHGVAFSRPATNGLLLFQDPELIPSKTNTLEENLEMGRLKYTPKQIMMSFIKFPIPFRKRLEYFLNVFEGDFGPAKDVVKLLVEGKEYGDIPDINYFFDYTMYQNMDHEGCITLILDAIDCPKHYLTARLHMANLFPITEYAHEVLPYAIYGQFVATRMGALYHSFVLTVDGLVVDEEEQRLVNEACDTEDLSAKVPSMSFNPDFRPGETRLSLDDLNIRDYIGN
ncbi:hypothetical protein [Vibrio phage VP4B]|uniref:Uncharacterized protein n=1 Tax=Vibrio phage VP4B TaxID=1262540 RepID=V9M022_9CAUD|nr:hypothetical protein FDJ61_gp181 [Vibrio phage VP4B]AGB07295.1 hypothetical protein [Vibrio phage VP4B]